MIGLRAASVIIAACGMSFPMVAAETPANEWKLENKGSGVDLYSRLRPGTSLKEFKAIGTIDAATMPVHKVIDDVDSYPDFMPFTKECKVLQKEGETLITYQRLSPKIVSDRDYTIRLKVKSWPMEGGMAFLNQWEPANELGPPEKKGVMRVKLCEGSWLLEPQGVDKTRATYSIYTDSGGALPAFIANKASEMGIRKIFAAVRKQVRDPKYAVSP